MFIQDLYDYSEDIRRLIIDNTALYLFTTNILIVLDDPGILFVDVVDAEDVGNVHHFLRRDIVLRQFEYLRESHLLKGTNLFTLAYFIFPHAQFVFDEFGNAISDDDHSNWEDKNVYLGQYKYCTKLIVETVGSIIENDPNSIIILQSDHSGRYPWHMNAVYPHPSHWKWDEEIQYMTSIMNAVYFQGDKIDIEGLSGTNTVIRVFNKVFGTAMPYAEQSFFAPAPGFKDP